MNYQEYMNLDSEKKFNYFMNSRFPTNRTPKYWVNWKKVLNNSLNYELMLNTMNYLVGKKDIKEKARELFKSQPNLISTIPVLLACRDKTINVLDYSNNNKLSFYNLNFDTPTNDIDLYVKFMEDSGLLDFLKNNVTKSLVDYVFGVEVGLDSNARKNRGGTINETILENNLNLVIKHNPHCDYMLQATRNKIKEKWNIDVPEALDSLHKGGRRYDGVLYNSKNKNIIIIETNFYGGGGSKLKSVSGEFIDMYNNYLKNADNINFIWLSDGPGWDTAKNPMRDAFKTIPNIINLDMVNKGFITEILKINNKY